MEVPGELYGIAPVDRLSANFPILRPFEDRSNSLAYNFMIVND
jgi:hypothetical protein